MEINVALLHYELANAGLPVIGVASDGRIDYSRVPSEKEIMLADQIVAVHDPNGRLPAEEVYWSSEVDAAAIAGWSTWTKADAAEWYQANVRDLLATIPNVEGMTKTAYNTNAQSIIVQMQKIITVQTDVIVRLWKMVIALRNSQWPNLEGSK